MIGQSACPHCGTPANPGEQFCGSCGGALSAAPGAPAPPPPAPGATAGTPWYQAPGVLIGGGVSLLAALVAVLVIILTGGSDGNGGTAAPVSSEVFIPSSTTLAAVTTTSTTIAGVTTTSSSTTSSTAATTSTTTSSSTTSTSTTTTSPTTTTTTTTTTIPAPPDGFVLSGGNTFGSFSLSAGFTPDPETYRVTSGGLVNAGYLGGNCVGMGASVPDIQFTWNGGGGFLRFYFLPDQSSDQGLVINDPIGEWHCNDDAFGTFNPSIDFPSALSGRYDIWVTDLVVGDSASGDIYVTEIDTNHP